MYNEVILSGKFTKDFEYHHEYKGTNHTEKFYINTLKIQRTSGTYDEVPVLVSEVFENNFQSYLDHNVVIYGELRTYNYKQENEHVKLLMHTLANRIDIQTEESNSNDMNYVMLSGYVCKKPVIRTTPNGKTIANIILAVNRSYNKTDYIPCIVWNKLALMLSRYDYGYHCKLQGRLQSRLYIKDKEGAKKEMIAYEVSAFNISVDQVIYS